MDRVPLRALHGRVEGLCRRNQNDTLAATRTPVGSSGFADADRADPPLSVDAGGGVAPGRDVLKNGTVRRLAPLLWAANRRARDPGRQMETGSIGPDICKSALIIVDMQNDFLHRELQPYRSGASRGPDRMPRRTGGLTGDFTNTSNKFSLMPLMRLRAGRGAAENTQDVDYPLGWKAASTYACSKGIGDVKPFRTKIASI
jgi:hypothetical protein